MDKIKFRYELEKIIIYANRHASDFYGLKDKKTFNKIFSIPVDDFIYKCYEGFKLAQDKIIDNLLIIEEELREADKAKRIYIKGKHKKDFENKIEYKKLEDQIGELKKQKYSFHDIANVIVWTIFRQQGTYVRSFLREDGGSGYLKDRDIESLIAVAKEMNKAKDTFALINDITSCLHSGDIIAVSKGSFRVVEVKRDSPVNNLVSRIISRAIEDEKIDMEALKELHKQSPKHGIRQIKRYMDQIISISAANRYMETDKIYDPYLKKEKSAINILTKDVDYTQIIDLALDELTKGERQYLILPFDCCIVGLFKKGNSESEYVRQMNFKHELYHSLVERWDKCQYGNWENIKFSENNPPEFIKYQGFKIYLLAQKMTIGGYLPLFLTLKEKHIIDLLTDKIGIYIYFDQDRFFKMCRERGLYPEWVDVEEYKKGESGGGRDYLPSFNGKYLKMSGGRNKKISFFLGYGMFFRMVYNFQSGYNVIDQIKENIWIRSHPKLSNIRDRAYFYCHRKYLQLMFFSRGFISKCKI